MHDKILEQTESLNLIEPIMFLIFFVARLCSVISWLRKSNCELPAYYNDSNKNAANKY